MPLLLLEDLSAAHWPPPWTREQLDAVHALRLSGLPAVKLVDEVVPSSWKAVQANPEPFLSLSLCSEGWLHRAINALVQAEQAGHAACAGEELLHVDVRSDNMCFDGARVVLIDWNFAAHGNGELDTASWLPRLQSEGGPAPEEILPKSPRWAALISGYFAAEAGLPAIPNAPRVRAVQLAQLRTALPCVKTKDMVYKRARTWFTDPVGAV